MKKILLMSIVGIFMILGTLAFVIQPVAAEEQDPCPQWFIDTCMGNYDECMYMGGSPFFCQAVLKECLGDCYVPWAPPQPPHE